MRFPLNKKFNLFGITSSLILFVCLIFASISPDYIQGLSDFHLTQSEFYKKVKIAAIVSILYFFITFGTYYGLLSLAKLIYLKK